VYVLSVPRESEYFYITLFIRKEEFYP